MTHEIDRAHVTPGQVTEGRTLEGKGYGHDNGPKDRFNYFVDDYSNNGMLFLYINTSHSASTAGLYMDPRDAEIMGLQLVYQARKMMKEQEGTK